MLVSDVFRSVQVCIEAIVTLTAKEQRLRTSVVTSAMPTTRTRLRRVAWVNLLDADTALLPFISNEAVQLGKCPTMQLAFVLNVLVFLAASNLGSLTDVGEIFKNNGCTSRGTDDNLLTEDMIAIPVETRLTLTQFLEVAFGGFSSFGLQFALEAKRATVNLFPSRVAKKVFVRGDSRAVESQVNANDGAILRHNRFGYGHDHMQPPLAIFVQQVGSGVGIAEVLTAKIRHREGNGLLAMRRRKSDHALCPIESVGMHVVTRTTSHTPRTLDRCEAWFRLAELSCFLNFFAVFCFVFSFPRKGTFERFGGLDTRLYQEVRHQPRTGRFGIVVRGMMQLDPVLFLRVPSVLTHHVIGMRELCQRLSECVGLFGGRMQV